MDVMNRTPFAFKLDDIISSFTWGERVAVQCVPNFASLSFLFRGGGGGKGDIIKTYLFRSTYPHHYHKLFIIYDYYNFTSGQYFFLRKMFERFIIILIEYDFRCHLPSRRQNKVQSKPNLVHWHSVCSSLIYVLRMRDNSNIHVLGIQHF